MRSNPTRTSSTTYRAAFLRTPPSGFTLVEGSYFDISTSADFDSASGFTITLPYDPSKVTDYSKLKLVH